MFDFVILGQGLAGTVLAWHLQWRGQSVLVMDDPEPNAASRIAAGLITPITGRRLVPSWRLSEFWPAAVAFYRRVERQTARHFFQEIPMVRLFESEPERERIRHLSRAEIPSPVRFPKPLVEKADFQNPAGGCEMTGGKLDVTEFLSASRDWFRQTGTYQTGRLALPEEVELTARGVAIPKWGYEARRLIFCQGFQARENPWFGRMPFDPAKGEILTIRVPGLAERRVIHCGIWLAPLGEDLFRAGASYDRENLDDRPTPGGRAEICDRLGSFLKRPFDVVDHQAAVRPIVLGRHPVMGRHPDFPQLGVFNGLGSKGALQSPFLAAQFAASLTGEGEIEDSVDLQKRFPSLFRRVDS